MKVKCISLGKFGEYRNRIPALGSIYTVTRVYKDKIYLEELLNWYKKEGFEEVEE